MKELLKIRCHSYFNEQTDYSEQNTCENEVFRTIIERTKHIQASAANLLHTVLELEIFVGANARSSHWRCSVKMGVLKISQNSQKNNCGRVSF